MNMKIILGAAALAFGSSVYFGKEKFNQYKGVLDNLQFNLKSIKGMKLSGGKIIFNCDVELINPTNVAVNIPGENIVVKNLHFYTPSGVYLGVASPNIAEISMPANGSRIITNIPVFLSVDPIGSAFYEILNIVSDPDLLQIRAELLAFGKSFIVNS